MTRMEGDCDCVLCSGKKPPVARRSDAFRLDHRMLVRSEGRTQSREVARVLRDDSSMYPRWLVSLWELTGCPCRWKIQVGHWSCIGERYVSPSWKAFCQSALRAS